VKTYDYIIVGAGSAGCVLAERLSRSGKHSVLLLEAGEKQRTPWISLPVGYGKTFYDGAVNWKFETQPDPGLDNRTGYWPRGKVVGGSGAINALVYARGLPNDFDDWAASGARGWGWNTVRAVYQDLETQVDTDGTTRGTGAIHVQNVSDQIHPVNHHYFDGVGELGLPTTDDMNGDTPEGAAIYRINTKNGRRMHSARAFLKPALKRANVTLVTGVMVERVVLQDRRATGIVANVRDQSQTFHAGRDVILSAGSVTSPRILQLSGIGPAGHLKSHGVTPVMDAPHVGGNLQDHLAVSYYFKATEPTLNNVLAPWWGKLMAGMHYALNRRGPLSLSVNQCGGYFKSDPSLDVPDQQLYFNPLTYTTTPDGKRTVIKPDPFAGFILSFQPARPTSRGRIDISRHDPMAAPLIQPNSLSTDTDIEQIVAGGRLCQRLAATRAITGLIKSAMDPDLRTMDDAGLVADFRKRCGTVYHPIGTCKMGDDPTTSVVDPNLRVHGIDGLRVVDASVFPNITSANTNAPTMMVAYRAADLILAGG
jgi:choline dehydrogenase